MADQTALARNMMMEFARDTGLVPAALVPRRYLWTDAFAVCNFLGLFRETGERDSLDLALRLVEQVHTTLGYYRRDDSRTGPISGLAPEEARIHPTAGGLRIGKGLKERGPGEPFDERLEWERDGQYYHYLTRWMHALNLVTKATGDFAYNRWAIELARAVHEKFVSKPFRGDRKQMHWKMSTDLSYPLVASMGLHDPLDGLITYTQLMATAYDDPAPQPDLEGELKDMADMCRGRRWVTTDLLGIGGLLCDAFRVAQLVPAGCFLGSRLLSDLLDDSMEGLKTLDMEDIMDVPANHRLAFREIGLSIGIEAVGRLAGLIDEQEVLAVDTPGLKKRVAAFKTYGLLTEAILSFWCDPRHQGKSWMDHRDINMVMLATGLSPAGYLTVAPSDYD